MKPDGAGFDIHCIVAGSMVISPNREVSSEVSLWAAE
jgi:hypothetical protein